MNAYPEYKSSGIDWLGDMPSHWKVSRLKHYISISNGCDPSLEGDIPVYGTGELPFKTCGEFKEGPTVLLGRKGSIDTPHWVDGKYWNVDTAFDTKVIGNYNIRYFWYIASIIDINPYKSTTAVPSMTQSAYDNMPIPVPSIEEQEAIAAYLDDVIGTVDALILEKQKQVEDLRSYRTSLITETVTRGLNPNAPLRPSGIDWLGDIPDHWKTSKIKYIGEIHGRIGYRGYTTEDLVEEGQGAYVIGGKHISKNILDLSSPDFISWEKYYESPEIMIKKGDIIIAQRGTLKRAAIIRDEIGCATINPSLALLNNISVNAIFLHYYLCSNAVVKFIDYLNTQTAVPMISQNQIENIHVVVPPISEQKAIAEFLDEKTEKIDALISELEKQLEELAEYKKAVISEAVTGKVDVRDWIPQN